MNRRSQSQGSWIVSAIVSREMPSASAKNESVAPPSASTVRNLCDDASGNPWRRGDAPATALLRGRERAATRRRIEEFFRRGY